MVGVLGLWSFIAGGTLRGADARTHTRTRMRSRGENRRQTERKAEGKKMAR